MAQAIITLTDDGADDVKVDIKFSPELNADHAAHRLCAVAIQAMQGFGEEVTPAKLTHKGAEVQP